MNSTARPAALQDATDKIDDKPPDHQVVEWFTQLFEPGQTFEVRAFRGHGRGAAVAHMLFTAEALPEAVKFARFQEKKGLSVYFTLNPVRGDLNHKQAASDQHILKRRLLLIDADPARPSGVSATADEKAAALATIEAIRDAAREWGWPEPALCDSGNGYHLLFRLDLPADDEFKDIGFGSPVKTDGPSSLLIKAVLVALNRRFGSAEVEIDTVVANASRVCKFYGTRARKGKATADRPHRYARVLDMPAELTPVPAELLRALAAEAEIEQKREQRAEPTPSATARPSGGDAGSEWTPERRASAWLAKCEPAISGQKGHNALLWAANVGPFFDLSEDVTFNLLKTEYNPRCQPSWTDAELLHKVREAFKLNPDRGSLLNADREGKKPRTARVKPSSNGDGETDEESGSTYLNVLDRYDKIGTNGANEAPDDPALLARMFLGQQCRHEAGLMMRYYRGEFLNWRQNAYRPHSIEDVSARLHGVIKSHFDLTNTVEIDEWVKKGKKDVNGKVLPKPLARKVTRTLVNNVVLNLQGYSHLDPSTRQPAWLDGADPFPAEDVLPTRNALVYLPWLIEGKGEAIVPATPQFFCPYALDYDFNTAAPKPVQFLAFLAQLFPDDPDSVGMLQEWFGYCLTPDTRQQKIAAMIGPKRSGKGTIARILRALIGPDNVAGPTLSGLAMNFGLSPLIGKPLAVIDDARLSGRADAAVIAERLLTISGEGTLDIDRKHMPAWTGKLPTRIMLISNELPRLSDSSGALAGRFILLRLTRSFYAKEDHGLTDRLMTELPGILLWAIEGWRRLRERGRFVQPESGQEMVEEMELLGSPISAFLKDYCDLAAGGETLCSGLFKVWENWCRSNGRKHTGTEQEFGRDLRAVIPHLKIVQRRPDRKRAYAGIEIKPEFVPSEATPDWRAQAVG